MLLFHHVNLTLGLLLLILLYYTCPSPHPIPVENCIVFIMLINALRFSGMFKLLDAVKLRTSEVLKSSAFHLLESHWISLQKYNEIQMC